MGTVKQLLTAHDCHLSSVVKCVDYLWVLLLNCRFERIGIDRKYLLVMKETPFYSNNDFILILLFLSKCADY